MKIIFTKSGLILSRAIRWIFKEPVSHVALVFDEKFTVHSNLYGVNLQWFDTFKKHCEIVYEIPYTLPLETEEKIFQDMLDTYDGNAYDFGAFTYFGIRGMLYRLFKVPMPKKNIWQDSHTFLCTEWADVAKKYLPKDAIIPDNDETDLAITTPYQMYLLLMKGKA